MVVAGRKSIAPPVLLEHIPAGDFRIGIVGGQQFGDVDAFGVALDLLHEDVNTHVVLVVVDLPSARIDEHLNHLGAHRIHVDVVAPGVREIVAQHGLVGVGSVDNPVGLLGHAEERDGKVVAVRGGDGADIFGVFAPDFEGILLLGKHEGARSANPQPASPGKVDRIGQVHPIALTLINKHRADRRVERGPDGGPKRIDHDQR